MINRRFIISLLFVITIGYVATDLYLPSLPAMAKKLKIEPSLAQLTIPLYMITFSLVHLFFGPLSDKIGRRPLILFGLIGGFLGSIACALAPTIWFLIGGRALQGVGLGAAVSVTRPIIRDVAQGDQFAHIASIITMGATAFMAGAPALGGYLQEYFGWRSSFIFLSLYMIIIFILSFFWIPETLKERNLDALNPKVFFRNYLYLSTNPIFMGYSLAASCALAGTISYFTVSPFILQNQMGLSSVAYGWSVIAIAIGMGTGGLVNGILLKYFGRHHSLLIGICLLFFGAILMLVPALIVFENPYTMVIPMAFFSIGMAVTINNSLAGAFSPFPKIAGFAGALFGSLFMLIAALGGTLIAGFSHQSPLLVSIFLLIFSFLALVLQWVAFLAVDKK